MDCMDSIRRAYFTRQQQLLLCHPFFGVYTRVLITAHIEFGYAITDMSEYVVLFCQEMCYLLWVVS